MRLTFVNRYYWPDESATSLMLTDLAMALAAGGHEVTVLTSRQRIEDAQAALAARETHAGVRIERLYTTRFGRASLPGRACDYLSFYLSALIWLLWRLHRGDSVIAKTDPPLIGVIAALAAAVKGARLVNWLQDVYPEVAVRLGVLSPRHPLVRLMTGLRNWSLRRAAANVVVGERMRDFIQRQEPRCAPVHVIHNWAQSIAASATPADDNPYRRELGLHGKVVFGYSGNLGRAHEFEGLVQAAAQLKDDTRLHFLIIGSGAQAQALRSRVETLGLGNWSFLPPQPRERLGLSLGAVDVHLVSLNPAMEGLIVPSKLYGILAAGRPCLFIGDADGEISRVLREQDCGLSASGTDPDALAQQLRRLAQTPSAREHMGQCAQRLHHQRFAHHHALSQWTDLLRAAGSAGLPGG